MNITKEQSREMVLDHIREIAKYWSSQPDMDVKQRCNGVAFSILNIFDGTSGFMPAMDIVLRPHEDDKVFHEEEGSDWFEDGMCINDDVYLHDLYYKDSK